MAENKWNSNLTFILAMIGSAVGLGNIWRYPYVLYSNGGGSFYIPYITAILVLGIPFLILEYGIGNNFKSSFAKTMRKINPKLEYLGWLIPVVIFMMATYYTVILGWDGIYFILSFFKGWGSDPNTYLTTAIIPDASSYTGLGNFLPAVGAAALIGWIIYWIISHRNLEAGIGKISRILVPTLFAITIIIVLFELCLPGSSIGLKELFKPDWSLLYDFKIWIAAFGQVIFSLNVGLSMAYTYASYLNDDSDLITNSLTVALANSLFENFCALGVFSVLGHMSLESGIPVDDLVSQGTGLIFVTIPTALNAAGQYAYIIGPLFFFSVYIAGITTVMAVLEPISFSIQNKFGITRKRSVTILTCIAAIGSMIYATSFGGDLISYADTFTNEIVLIFAVILECIAFTWIFKSDFLIDSLNSKSKSIKINRGWLFIVKYILPIILLIVGIGGLISIASTWTTIQLYVTIILAVILLTATLILTLIPARNPKFNE